MIELINNALKNKDYKNTARLIKNVKRHGSTLSKFVETRKGSFCFLFALSVEAKEQFGSNRD